MGPEHKLLLAISHILKPSYPHLDDLHAEVGRNATEQAKERAEWEERVKRNMAERAAADVPDGVKLPAPQRDDLDPDLRELPVVFDVADVLALKGEVGIGLLRVQGGRCLLRIQH